MTAFPVTPPVFSKKTARNSRAVFSCRYFHFTLFLFAFGGFLIRFFVSCQLIANDPATYAPSDITDMETYQTFADAILQGRFLETFYYQPFYYSVFLPLCRVFTKSPYVLALAQSLLGGAVIYMAGLIGGMISGRRAGFWSALLCALSAILIYFTPYALIEILQSFWIILVFILVLLALRREKLLLWCLAGFFLGCSILTRGNTWCFLPPVVLAAFYQWRPNWKRALFPILLFLVFAILPQLPFAAYNTFRTGKLSGPSTAGGAVLCIGNNPESAPGGLDIPYPPTYNAWMETEKSVSIPTRMFEWFKREPWAFLELQFNKFLLFWDSSELPNNISEFNAEKSSLMRTLHFLPTGFLLMLALAGGFSGFYHHMFLRRKKFLLLWGFILFYAFSVSAFYILARFRLPIIPLLCVSGGVFLAPFLRFWKIRRLFHYLLMLIPAMLLVYFVYPVYSTIYEPSLMRSFRPGGVISPLNSYQVLIQDHTQRIRDGWGLLMLRDGMTIQKTFRLYRDPAYGPMTGMLLRLPVLGAGFSFQLDINNFYSVTVNKAFTTIQLFPDNQNDILQLNMRIRNVQGQPMLFFDNLRSYGRTQVNGEPVPCELVATLIEEFASDKDGRK